MNCNWQPRWVAALVFFIAPVVLPNIVVGQWAKTGRPVERVDRWLGVGNGAGYHWRTPGPNVDYYQPWSHLNSHPAAIPAYHHCVNSNAAYGNAIHGNSVWIPNGPLDSNWGYPTPSHPGAMPPGTLPTVSPPGQEFSPMTQPQPPIEETTFQPSFPSPSLEIAPPNMTSQPSARFVQTSVANAPRSIWTQALETSPAFREQGPSIVGPQTSGTNRAHQAELWLQSLERQRKVYQR